SGEIADVPTASLEPGQKISRPVGRRHQQEVEVVEPPDGAVERLPGLGMADFDGRDSNHLGAKGRQRVRERASLLARPGDDDSLACQWVWVAHPSISVFQCLSASVN